jgi:hypothetical protein
MMLIHGVSHDGEKLAVLRTRDDRVEAGIVRKVKDGEPLHGELLRLTPRPDCPLVCDVEVALPAATPGSREQAHASTSAPTSPPRLSHGGPAQVATPSYRSNWDAIWSRKPPSTLN